MLKSALNEKISISAAAACDSAVDLGRLAT